MSIACVLASEHYNAGETALCLLKGIGSGEAFEDSIIYAQIHGHVNSDFRWIKTSRKINDYFVQPALPSIEKIQYSPNDPAIEMMNNHTSTCMFCTSRIALSPTHIFEGGLLLEFEIPCDVIPSYRGLSAIVNHYLTLLVQHPTSSEKLHFPIIIHGQGSASIPFHLRHSSMVGYPVSSLPLEAYLSAPALGISLEERLSSMALNEQEGGGTGNGSSSACTYMVRDQGLVCCLKLQSRQIRAGQNLGIHLDFSQGQQECRAVRSTLVVSEMRLDGSKVQDKAVGCCIRCAEDAERLNLSLHLPNEAVCSFESPLFKVDYRVDFDFCLKGVCTDTNGASPGASKLSEQDRLDGATLFDSAFSFSIPVKVVLPLSLCTGATLLSLNTANNSVSSAGGGGAVAEAASRHWENYHQSSAVIQQRALQCLESECYSVPIVLK